MVLPNYATAVMSDDPANGASVLASIIHPLRCGFQRRAGAVWPLTLVCALLAAGGVARAEPVQFASAAVNPTPFAARLAERHGTLASPTPGDMIAGDIYKPEGAGPFPAIVVMHGCEGWPSLDGRRQTAERYVAQGYVLLEVDSFGPRGIEQACVPTPGNRPADRPGDAYGALDWLSTQSFVDASRVALMGASQGGSVVLFALSKDGVAQASAHRFAAGIAYYPVCAPNWAVVTAPVLVLVGALDDWTPAADCRAMGDMSHSGGASETVVVLPDAYHAFDGVSVRDHPREVFGHHLEYNEAATRAAHDAVNAFLLKTLKY
jgi:dienelactone hydrolase